MSDTSNASVGIVTAIIGVAILAVIVSGKSTTVSVIQTAASALGNLLGVVVAPISSGSAAASSSNSAPAPAQQSSAAPASVNPLQQITSLANALPHMLSSVNSLGSSLTALSGTGAP